MGTATPAIDVISTIVKPPPGFQDLYQRYSEAVYRTALRVTGNAADAEDVLQTVFLRLMRGGAAPDPAKSPEQYLRRAATNAAIDLIRRKNWLSETAIDETYPARENSALLKERLRRALAKLPAEDAELFALCYLEGYSYDELAAQFNLERGTVASRLSRTRAILRQSLSK
jgi:RNA polymerase sigma-70 factor, ECF subfamily